MYYTLYDSPIQTLRLVSNGEALMGLYMESKPHQRRWQQDWVQDDAIAPFAAAKQQLAAYFAGQLTQFDLPLHRQGTPFQMAVWQALGDIPYGVTWSYGQLAHHLGKPTAARAVGLANGRNPLSIVVPCHRVVGAKGTLTGYGGGLGRKQWLLDHERQVQGA
jgi:methylated-DNA-[protein]-cysteine S-methyltransferase